MQAGLEERWTQGVPGGIAGTQALGDVEGTGGCRHMAGWRGDRLRRARNGRSRCRGGKDMPQEVGEVKARHRKAHAAWLR